MCVHNYQVFIIIKLAGGFKHVYFPFNIWDVSLPIDELIFFKIVSAPPNSKYLCIFMCY